MKKLLTVLLGIMMIISLSACSQNGGGEETGGDDNTTLHVGIVQLVQHTALDAATKGFIDALKAEIPDVDINELNASGDPATCSTIVNGFVNDNVDLIMANATPALQAAVAATGDIPILGTSVTEYGVALGIDNFNGLVGSNVSGTSDLAPLDQQAQMILDILPDTKNVGIIYCSSEANSVYQVKVVEEYLTSKGVNVISKAFTDSNDVALVTEDLCSQAEVLYIPTDNTAASSADTIANVVLDKKVPVFSGEEGICAKCGVATLTISYYDLGVTTGKMAAAILKGEKNVAEMPIQYFEQPVKKYNPEICEMLGVEVPEDFVAIE